MKIHSCILRQTMFVTFLLLSASLLHAQYVVKATIPFDFSAGDQRFSAGEYTLTPVVNSARSLMLRDANGRVLIFSANRVETTDISDTAKLIFNRYGKKYFLAQLWEPWNDAGYQMIRSRAEVETARTQESPGDQIALNFSVCK